MESSINIYIVYEISKYFNVGSYSTIENVSAVSFNIDRYKYFGYGIGFDGNGYLSHPSGGIDRIVIVSGVDMSSSAKIDNKRKDILILGKGPTQGFEHALSAEKIYSFNFTENNKELWLSLHYIGANGYVFVNSTEIHKFKAKDSENVATPLCLENI